MTETQTADTAPTTSPEGDVLTVAEATAALAALGVEIIDDSAEGDGIPHGKHANDLPRLAGMLYARVLQGLNTVVSEHTPEVYRQTLAGFRYMADTRGEHTSCNHEDPSQCGYNSLLLLTGSWTRDGIWLNTGYKEQGSALIELCSTALGLAYSAMAFGHTPDDSEIEARLRESTHQAWLMMKAAASKCGLPGAVDTGRPPLPFIFVADRWHDEQWKRVAQGHTGTRDGKDNTAEDAAAEIFAWIATRVPADELPSVRVRIWATRTHQFVEMVGMEHDAVYTIEDYARDEAEAESAAQSADSAAADEHAEAAEAGSGYGHAATIAEAVSDVG